MSFIFSVNAPSVERAITKIYDVTEKRLQTSFRELKVHWRDELVYQQKTKQGEWADWSGDYAAHKTRLYTLGIIPFYEKLKSTGNLMSEYKPRLSGFKTGSYSSTVFPSHRFWSLEIPFSSKAKYAYYHQFSWSLGPLRPFDLDNFIELVMIDLQERF